MEYSSVQGGRCTGHQTILTGYIRNHTEQIVCRSDRVNITGQVKIELYDGEEMSM